MKLSGGKGFDVIGDIHGCADAMIALLEKLGYSKQQGVYRHATRKVIFVGDIIDRGPKIREALHIVKDMVEGGAAEMVMGNHEYNALTYFTPSPPGSSQPYLVEHTNRRANLLRETIDEFANFQQDWKDFLAWFMERPLFLERDNFRVVHAYWDADLITQFRHQSGGNVIDSQFLEQAATYGSFAFKVMERLLRGLHIVYPDGITVVGADGLERNRFRTKFWETNPTHYKDIVFQPDGLPKELEDRELAPQERDQVAHYADHELPLFVGHYWHQGYPTPLADNIACLDYSAVKTGRLVAYRMDRETRLSADKFVWVDVATV